MRCVQEESVVLLGINIDHVATLRQARATDYPDPIAAAKAALRGGADQITLHLREDRRHIQDLDVARMRSEIDAPMNLEMAAAADIVKVACEIKPDTATLVPERRQELTTEGGLDVAGLKSELEVVIQTLKQSGIGVSLFIDPDREQVDASLALGIDAIELHTGAYGDAVSDGDRLRELEKLMLAARHAKASGLKVCAGHGINYANASELARALPEVVEYNIGHAVIARALFVGAEEAVRLMKALLE